MKSKNVRKADIYWNLALSHKSEINNELFDRAERTDFYNNAIENMRKAKNLYQEKSYIKMCNEQLLDLYYKYFYFQAENLTDKISDHEEYISLGKKLLQQYKLTKRVHSVEDQETQGDICWNIAIVYEKISKLNEENTLEDINKALEYYKMALGFYKRAKNNPYVQITTQKITEVEQEISSLQNEKDDNPLDYVDTSSSVVIHADICAQGPEKSINCPDLEKNSFEQQVNLRRGIKFQQPLALLSNISIKLSFFPDPEILTKRSFLDDINTEANKKAKFV